MNAKTDFDVGPLTWVKTEIDLALDRARQALMAYCDGLQSGGSEADTQLRFARTHLHQAHGALEIVDFEGVTKVTEAVEQLLVELGEGRLSASGTEAAQVAAKALDGIRQYLDRLLNGEPNQPLWLFPFYHDVLILLNRKRISPADLFFPDLSLRPLPRPPSERPLSAVELAKLLRSERGVFQRGLLRWLQGNRSGTSQMLSAVRRIEAAQDNPLIRTFWWISLGFVATLVEDKTLDQDIEAKQLCARIDLQIRRLMEGTPNVAESLMRDALYFIGQSSAKAPEVQRVKDTFQLQQLIPAVNLISSVMPEANLLRCIRESLANAEESWSKFCAGSSHALAMFSGYLESLLGFVRELQQPDMIRLLEAVLSVTHQLDTQHEPQPDAVAMEVATALLLIQNAEENFAHLTTKFTYQVDTMVRRLKASTDSSIQISDSDLSLFDEMTRRAQEKLLLAQVAREIQTNLLKIEQVLDSFFRDPTKRADLLELDVPIKQVLGALTIIHQNDAGMALESSAREINRFASEDYVANESDFEKVAQELSLLGFFIDELQHNSTTYTDFVRSFEQDAQLDEFQVAASVEAELEQQKREAQALIDAYREKPTDTGLREELKKSLETLKKDADLIADTSLGQQAEAVLVALKDSPQDAEIDPALTHFMPAMPEAPMPSAETIELTQASTEELDAEFLAIFLEEANEVLATIDESLQSLRSTPNDREVLTTIRRSFHTLKGSGRMVGLKDLGEVAWEIEQTLNVWLRQELSVTHDLLETLDESYVVFADWVKHLEGQTPVAPDTSDLVKAAVALRADEMSTTLITPLQSEPPPPPVADTEIAEEPAEEIDTEEIPIFAQPDDLDIFPAAEDTAVEDLYGKPLTSFELGETVFAPLAQIAQEESALPNVEETNETLTDSELDINLGDDGGIAEVSLDFGLESIPHPIAYEATEEAAEQTEAMPVFSFDDALEEVRFSEEVTDELPPSAEPEQLFSEEEEALSFPDLEAFDVQIAEPAPSSAEEPLPDIESSETVTPTLYSIFMEEARGHVDVLKAEVASLETDSQAKVSQEIIRAAHTLGGIAGTVGILPINHLGLALEHALQRARRLPSISGDYGIQIIGRAVSALAKMYDDLSSGAEAKENPGIVTALEGLYRQTVSPTDLHAPENDLWTSSEIDGSQEIVVGAEADELTDEIEPVPVEMALPVHDVRESRPAVETIVGATALPMAESQDRHETADTGSVPLINDEIDEQLLPIFLEEAHELIRGITEHLLQWRRNTDDESISPSLARLLHTLKGNARMAGAMSLGELTHAIESRVSEAQADGVTSTKIDEIETEFDLVAQYIDRLQHGEMPVLTPAAPVAVERGEPEAIPVQSSTIEQPVPATDQSVLLRVRADLVDRLINEAGELSIARARIEGEMRGLKDSLLDLTENVIRLRRQLREIEIQAETQIQSRIATANELSNEFDPLELDRFTRSQELTRMMAESVNDVATVQQSLLKNLDDANAALLAQARLNREHSQALMSVRLVPFASQVPRLYRIVRQTAKQVNKRANLDIQGTEVEIDRSVLEHILAPLEHMLRNAVTHGIEARQTRLERNKPEIGEITIRIAQESNEIVLSLSDDGGGLDFERIRAKAVADKLIGENEEITPERAADLVFRSGFSTAQELSQVSGRGVGLDVVKTGVTSLGGRIEASSIAGQGTTFRIYLPLTLSLMQTLLVRVGPRLYAIPSSMIEQVLEFKVDDLEKARTNMYVEWMGNQYPFRFLPHLLGETNALPEAHRRNPILLLKSGSMRLAVQLDELRGNQEVVVKNIGPQLSRVVGIVGATVLGDGHVVLIVNPVALAARAPTVSFVPEIQQMPAVEVPQPVTLPTIMVVDDSLTVRKIASRLFAREGYHVLTAKDGVDALEQMVDAVPDVMMVDIEMPRMDGFDLTRNVRGDPRLKNVPIIMVTSRTAEKHRKYASEIGVNHYLGKPYQEEELLSLVKGYLPGHS